MPTAEAYVPSPKERLGINRRRKILRKEMQRSEVFLGLGDELSDAYTKEYEQWAEEEAKLVYNIRDHEALVQEAHRLLKHQLLNLQKENHKQLLRGIVCKWWKEVRQKNQGKTCERIMLILGEPKKLRQRKLENAFIALRINSRRALIKKQLHRALRLDGGHARNGSKLMARVHGAKYVLRWGFIGWWTMSRMQKETKKTTGGSQYWPVGPNEAKLRKDFPRSWYKQGRLCLSRTKAALGRARMFNRATKTTVFYRWKTEWYESNVRVKFLSDLLGLKEQQQLVVRIVKEWSNYAYERKVEETTSENFILFQSLAATELKAWESRIQGLYVSLEEAMAAYERKEEIMQPKTHAEYAERAAARHRRESPQSPLFFRRQYEPEELVDDIPPHIRR
jgi:hypothetical protein